MADILSFPRPYRPIPRIERTSDLPAGTKAIVVIRDSGGFAAVIYPAFTSRERAVRKRFESRSAALRFARWQAMQRPFRYRMIIDRTGGEAAHG